MRTREKIDFARTQIARTIGKSDPDAPQTGSSAAQTDLARKKIEPTLEKIVLTRPQIALTVKQIALTTKQIDLTISRGGFLVSDHQQVGNRPQLTDRLLGALTAGQGGRSRRAFATFG